MFNDGNLQPLFLVRFSHHFAEEIFIIRASDAALRFLTLWIFLEMRGRQGDPPPLIKISLLLKHQRPKLKIGRAASLDIILKICHTIFVPIG